MTLIAPTLQAFFTKRLLCERNASPETVASYRDTIRLLVNYAHDRTGKAPYQLGFDDLDASLIGAFLSHLETDRHNSPSTRNNRLAAIHSFYRYAALSHPEHAQTIARVMAIPTKRHCQKDISYLDLTEVKALLQAPDCSTWLGRRDHALLLDGPNRGAGLGTDSPSRWRPHLGHHGSPPSHRQGTQASGGHSHRRDLRDPPPMARRTPRPAR